MAEIIDNTTSVSGGDAAAGTETNVVLDYDAMYDAMYTSVYDATMTAAVDLESTDGQSINSSALTYFEGILLNQRVPQDYVVWVGEDYTYESGYGTRTAYEYCMLTGDLDAYGQNVTGDGTLYTIRLSGDVGVTVEEVQDAAVWVPYYYGRSNFDGYSGIVQRDWCGALTLICLVGGGLVWFVGKLLRVKF